MRDQLSNRLSVFLALVAVFTGFGVASASSAFATATGQALLKRVEQAYQKVPGVSVSTPFGRFTEILRHGSVTSETYSDTNSKGTTKLVSINGSPTYAEEPDTTCWRTLARSNGQTLTDIGHQLLYSLGTTVTHTQSTANGWTLTLSYKGAAEAVAVNKALLVQTIAFTQGKTHIRESFTTLTRTPALPRPKPRCD